MSDFFKFEYIDPKNIILNKDNEDYGTFIEGNKSGIKISTFQQPTDLNFRNDFIGGDQNIIIAIRNDFNTNKLFYGESPQVYSINTYDPFTNEFNGGDQIIIYDTGTQYGISNSRGPYLRLGKHNIISEKPESKVGIGTLFPAEKVHISGGNLRVEGNVFANNLYTKDNPSGFITGVDLSAYVTKSSGAFTNRPTVNGTGVLLSGEAAGLPTTILYTTGNQIKSGRLIIGDDAGSIVDPNSQYTLSLQTNSPRTWLEILNNSGANKGVFFGIEGNNFEQYNWQGGDIIFFTAENVEAGYARLIIKNDGKVGIGISSPSEKLEIDGNIKASGGSFDNRPTVNGTGVVLSGEAYPSNNPSGFITGVDLSAYATNANLNLTGSTLNTKINSLSGSAVLLYGNQTIDGTKTFRNSVYIHDLYVTGTEFIANVENNFIESPYILLNLTGGAVDGGIFFVTGTGLTGINDYGPIIGFDHTDQFKFGIARRSDDLSTLDSIAGISDITNYSGFANNNFYLKSNPSGFITGVDLTSYATKTNLETTGSTLNTKIDNLSGTVTSNYVTKTNGEFTNRPTVNGTGVLLNGEPAEYVFPDNLIVSLSSGKTFGRYRNGETILSSGKTTSQVLQLAIVEPIIPTVLLTTSSSIAFNQTGINNILNASNTINSLNASVQTGYIEWRRGGVGAWTQLTGNILTGFSFIHSLTDTNFNTSGFNYRYIVTDTVGATNTGNLTITPAAYVSPTLSSTSIGVTPADLGNISGTLSTTINRNSLNVNLTGYQLQYQTGVSWVNIGSLTSISSSPHSLNVIHNDSSLRNINSINYRIQVYDQYQVTALTMGTRSFLYRNYLGYSPNTSLTLSEIESLISSTLSNSKSRTVTNVTAGAGNYTYYCYQAAAGDLTSIIQDGAAPVIGAFTKLSNVTGLNTYGANVTYIVYRSNATNAFTNNTLAFS